MSEVLEGVGKRRGWESSESTAIADRQTEAATRSRGSLSAHLSELRKGQGFGGELRESSRGMRETEEGMGDEKKTAQREGGSFFQPRVTAFNSAQGHVRDGGQDHLKPHSRGVWVA